MTCLVLASISIYTYTLIEHNHSIMPRYIIFWSYRSAVSSCLTDEALRLLPTRVLLIFLGMFRPSALLNIWYWLSWLYHTFVTFFNLFKWKGNRMLQPISSFSDTHARCNRCVNAQLSLYNNATVHYDSYDITMNSIKFDVGDTFRPAVECYSCVIKIDSNYDMLVMAFPIISQLVMVSNAVGERLWDKYITFWYNTSLNYIRHNYDFVVLVWALMN